MQLQRGRRESAASFLEVRRGPKTLIKAEGDSFPTLVSLSTVDLLARGVHAKTFHAFQGPVPANACDLLRAGLSEALSEYQEFAGRICENSDGRPAIYLNNAGGGWINAEADVALSDIVPISPGRESLDLLPPCQGIDELLIVQLTRFKCGGIVLATALHHNVIDATSAWAFMGRWASAVRKRTTGVNEALLPSPLHDRSALTPIKLSYLKFDHLEYRSASSTPKAQMVVETPAMVTKALHFNPKQLKVLKSEAMKGSRHNTPFTTFESLTAHIWRSITLARGLAADTESKLAIAMDGRSRLIPKLPENYFGSVTFHSCAKLLVRDLLEKPFSHITEEISKAIKKVDNDYIRSYIDLTERRLRNSESVIQFDSAVSATGIQSPHLFVTSWGHVGWYDLDFGWGGPVFVGPSRYPAEGRVMFVPSYTRDGSIDVVVGLLASEEEALRKYAYELPGVDLLDPGCDLTGNSVP